MAEEDVSEPARGIQFSDGIQPARTNSHAPGVDDTAAKDTSTSEKTLPIDDEEQARKIADEDLNTHRKQV